MPAIGRTQRIRACISHPDGRQHKHEPPTAFRQIAEVQQIGTDPAEVGQSADRRRKIKRGLVSAALISLVDLQEADAWAVCIIIGREFAVTGLRSIAVSHGLVIAASKLGKWKMASQIVGISLMIMGGKLDDIGLWRKTGRAALYVMTAMALISGIDYFRRFLKPLLAKEREEAALAQAAGTERQLAEPEARLRKTAL